MIFEILSGVVGWSMVVFALALAIVTKRQRMRIFRNHLRVAGRFIRARGVQALVEWTFMGQVYISTPPRLYTLKRGERVGVFLAPDSGQLKHLDVWTENYAWGYVLSALVGSGGLLLLGIQFSSLM